MRFAILALVLTVTCLLAISEASAETTDWNVCTQPDPCIQQCYVSYDNCGRLGGVDNAVCSNQLWWCLGSCESNCAPVY